MDNKDKKSFLILDNIRSVYNVGAIFRTADAIGISKIYLVGYTPSPFDRFKIPRKDFAKASLGSEKTIQWEQYEDIDFLIKKLKKENIDIVAIEQSNDSIDYKEFEQKNHTAFIFGNEVSGISKDILKRCNAIIEMPMRGNKESLNVSVSAGIILFKILDI